MTEKKWKEAVKANFMELSQHMHSKIQKTHEPQQDSQYLGQDWNYGFPEHESKWSFVW